MTGRQKPIIGVTLDSEPPGGFSAYPWYALRCNYFDAIAAAGGVAIALPHHPALAADMLDLIDGLVITGGAFDVDPALYGDETRHETVLLKPQRTDAERAFLHGALARNMPVLGICGGQQLMAVALGGTLIQHIPDSVADALPHEQTTPHTEPAHTVTIAEHSFLRGIVGSISMRVNSSHHQAVREPGPFATVNAMAPDGVIEGIEDRRYRFCLGLQWHPEFQVDPGDAKLFAAFVAASRG